MHNLLSFPDSSRIWIYQGDRVLDDPAVEKVNRQIQEFAEKWTSHNIMLKATGGLLHDRFIVLVANEEAAGASGCSIDASVRFVKGVGEEHDIDYFERLNFAYLSNDRVLLVHRDDLATLYGDGQINDDTLFFDNLVRNKGEFLANWLVPFGQSWMKRFV